MNFKKAIIAQQEGNVTFITQFLQQLSDDEVNSEQCLNLALFSLINGDFQQRWAISKFFTRLDKIAFTPLLKILADNTAEVELRWFVCRILGGVPEPEVVLSLVKILQESEHEELVTMASESLGKIGKKAINGLIPLLEDQDRCVLAIKALSQIRSPEIIFPLVPLVNDKNSEIRSLVIETLGSFHNDKISQILVKALEDQAAKVRKEAVIALGFRHAEEITPEIVNKLVPLLNDFHPEVCQQTALSLGKIATKEAIEALFYILKSPNLPVWLQLPIVRALGWCENNQAIAYLGDSLAWVDSQTAEETISILGKQVKNELKQQATDILINYLYSLNLTLEKIEIRQKIAIGLGELKQKNAQKALELLAKDTEKTVQLHANFALKQLTIDN